MAPRTTKTEPAPEITEPFLVKLQAWIRAHEGQGVTAAGLSKEAGLADNAIRRWFAGTSKTLTISSARKVCKAMGTTLELFLASAQTEEELSIVALATQLSEQQLRRLLDYGEGLRDGSRPSPPVVPEGSE